MEGIVLVGVTAVIGIVIALVVVAIAKKRRSRVDPKNDIPN